MSEILTVQVVTAMPSRKYPLGAVELGHYTSQRWCRLARYSKGRSANRAQWQTTHAEAYTRRGCKDGSLAADQGKPSGAENRFQPPAILSKARQDLRVLFCGMFERPMPRMGAPRLRLRRGATPHCNSRSCSAGLSRKALRDSLAAVPILSRSKTGAALCADVPQARPRYFHEMESQMEANDQFSNHITPEMTDAGVEKLYEFPISDPTPRAMGEAVTAVFRAMLLAQRKSDF